MRQDVIDKHHVAITDSGDKELEQMLTDLIATHNKACNQGKLCTLMRWVAPLSSNTANTSGPSTKMFNAHRVAAQASNRGRRMLGHQSPSHPVTLKLRGTRLVRLGRRTNNKNCLKSSRNRSVVMQDYRDAVAQ